jgi:hypothetical protein
MESMNETLLLFCVDFQLLRFRTFHKLREN